MEKAGGLRVDFSRALPLLCLACATACGARTGLSVPKDGAVDVLVAVDAADAPEAFADVGDTLDAHDASDVEPSSPCPTSPPASGGDCATRGQICTYRRGVAGPCGSASADLEAFRCERDGWLEVAHCTSTTGCPTSPPVEGAACDEVGRDCFYATEGCAPRGVVQCLSGGFRWVNACAVRAAATECHLVTTRPAASASDPDLLASKEGQNVEYPTLAAAGTQLAVGAWVDAGASSDHDAHGFILQSATPSSMAPRLLDAGSLLGRYATSGPFAAFGVDAFVAAYRANDGWPVTTTAKKGLYVRAKPLTGLLGAPILVAEAAEVPTGIATDGRRALVAWRQTSALAATKWAGHAAEVDLASGIARWSVLVNDEAAPSPYSPQVAAAVVQVARSRAYWVVASTQPAAGDEVDDSGVRVSFRSAADPSKEIAAQRVVATQVVRFAIAVLSDDAVVVVTQTRAAPDVLALHVVTPTGGVTSLPTPAEPTKGTVFSATVQASDDGFVLAYFVQAGPTSAWLRLRKLDRDGQEWPKGGGLGVARLVEGVALTDRLALAIGETDRTVHVAWSQPLGVPRRLAYQRWACERMPGG